MPDADHDLTIGRSDGRFVATCSCGWTSFVAHTRAAAEVQARWHVGDADESVG